ncbi:MAG TPA: enoyl-CoA hydratase [Gemmatimonadaceae bacterium]|nr:enoyl-CoA hydratase [Gemmatimonadaceae bacterium]
MSDESGTIRLERRGATAFITFDRPSARNAMTWSMYEQLGNVLDSLASEPGLRVAVLRGAGGHFAAGTDIAQFAAFESAEDGAAYERRIDALIARLDALPVATIAAVEGFAAGAGLVLAAACDLRVCTPDARFGVPIAKTLGNCLSMANYARLVASLGAARTKALLFMADFMTADEAHALGFVSQVIEPHAFARQLDALTARVAALAPITLQVTREVVRRMVARLTVDGDDLVHRAYGSADFREGVTAFVAKRSPRWEGR